MITILPAVVAEITEALPSRIRRRVDALLAEGVVTGPVVSFGNATVSLHAELITQSTQLVCDCLLAPTCAHRAVVALSLRLDEGEDDGVSAPSGPVASTQPHPQGDDDIKAQPPAAPVRRRLSRAQRELAELVLADLRQVLLTGSAHLDAAARSRLVVDLHRMRVAQLVLADRALTAFVHDLTGSPATRCASFAAASLNLHQLVNLPSEAEADDLLGRSREEYRPIKGLRLSPLFAEPILVSSGFAGVQVTFQDRQGGTWQLVRMRPGGTDKIEWLYQAGETWAGISASQLQLSRHQLLIANGTARKDGRLGSGRQVRAAIQAAWNSWGEVPEGYRVVAGAITGGNRHSLMVADETLQLLPAAQTLGAGLATELFGAAVGTQVRCLSREGRLLGMIPGEGMIQVPAHLGGVWWPGLDRVDRSWVGQLPELSQATVMVDTTDWGASSPQIRAVTQRWCQRVLDAGPAVLSSPMLDRDAAWLRAAGAPFASELLIGVRAACQQGTRRFDGTWQPDPLSLHLAWLGLSQY